MSTDTAGGKPDETSQRARPKHSMATRWMHWLNVPLLAIMLWSGLRIYNANDVHAIDVLGLRFDFFPQAVFETFDADRRLAKGIAYHLTFGWLFALNGVAYGAYLAGSGRWREVLPDRRTLRDLPAVVAHDLRLRREAPAQGKYNAAQRLAYSAVIAMGAVMLASGFAIYKPTQLKLLVVLLGGYQTARLIHFTTSLLIGGFFVLHIVQVARAGWRNFASVINGYELVAVDPVDPVAPDDGAATQNGQVDATAASAEPEPATIGPTTTEAP